MNIKNYIFETILAPKKFIISEPGIIINKFARKYGSPQVQMRAAFGFEDIVADLQLATIKELGEKKSAELWYKIGKDVGFRYMMLANAKKIPSFLLSSVVEYIFKGFKSGGQSFAENVSFSLENKELILNGKDNIVCRKTGEGNFSAGIASSIMSFLTGENIEAECFCLNCPNCKIVSNPKIKEKYLVDIKKLIPDKLYYQLNFPKNVFSHKGEYSFNDLVKFKKIQLDNSGKWFLKNNFLIPGEIGMREIFFKNFVDSGLKELCYKTIIKSSEKIATNLLVEEKKAILRLKKIFNIFCALGNGISTYSVRKDNISVKIMFAPYSKYGFNYFIAMLNGFINSALGKNYKCNKVKFNKNNSSLVLIFS